MVISDMFATRYPKAFGQLNQTLFRSLYPFEFEVQQVGLRIDHLAYALDGAPVDFFPGVPIRAVRSRQLTYLAGRLCAENALCHGGAQDIEHIGRGNAGEPIWPASWTGSISHTDNFAFAAVSRKVGRFAIGIDAEVIVDDQAQKAILEVCVNDTELCHMASELYGTHMAATVLFAAKEAYYKAVYGAVQRFIDFHEVCLASLDLASGCFQIRPTAGTGIRSDLPVASGRFIVDDSLVMACVAPGY